MPFGYMNIYLGIWFEIWHLPFNCLVSGHPYNSTALD